MSISQTKKRNLINSKNKSLTQSVESLQKIAQVLSKHGQQLEVKKFKSGLVIRYGEELHRLTKNIPNLKPAKSNENREVADRKKRLENYRNVMHLMYANESFEAKRMSGAVLESMSEEEKAFYREL